MRSGQCDGEAEASGRDEGDSFGSVTQGAEADDASNPYSIASVSERACRRIMLEADIFRALSAWAEVRGAAQEDALLAAWRAYSSELVDSPTYP